MAYMHDFWVLKDKLTFTHVTRRVNELQEKYDVDNKRKSFSLWVELTLSLRKQHEEAEELREFKYILEHSTRGHRSTMEKELVRRFIVNNLTCIPKSISFSEMDTLCNELDWIPLIGRSILFLQGDFGNCYYMIARGRVGLYLEPSKDREMTVAREFGHLRGQPFKGTDEDLNGLGNNIFNLPPGAGFGEYAILATTNKIRSCACVAMDEDSMLLIMHADTYNTVLRQHHYRQKQLSTATALLQELPLFKHHTYPQVASVAYTMRSQTYSNQTTVVSYGDIINNVLLVANGQIKVFAPPKHDTDEAARENPHLHKMLKKRMPKLAIALLGRGQIIGEMELQQGIRAFQMTYVSASASTEVLEMPATVFKDAIVAGSYTQSMFYKSLDEISKQRDMRRVGQMERAYGAMKEMMSGNIVNEKAHGDISTILPVIMDTPTTTGGAGAAAGLGGGDDTYGGSFSVQPQRQSDINYSANAIVNNPAFASTELNSSNNTNSNGNKNLSSPAVRKTTSGSFLSSPRGRPGQSQFGSFLGETSQVTRKASFAVHLTEDEAVPIAKQQLARLSANTTGGGAGSGANYLASAAAAAAAAVDAAPASGQPVIASTRFTAKDPTAVAAATTTGGSSSGGSSSGKNSSSNTVGRKPSATGSYFSRSSKQNNTSSSNGGNDFAGIVPGSGSGGGVQFNNKSPGSSNGNSPTKPVGSRFGSFSGRSAASPRKLSFTVK